MVTLKRSCTRWWFMLLVVVLWSMPCSSAYADATLFSDGFDDGNYTTNPRWEVAVAGPVSVSSDRATSGSYSLKVATNNQQGAIRAFSGVSSATQSYTSTFNLFIESMGDEAIPWCLQSTSNGIMAIIFILPGGKVELFVADRDDIWSGKTAYVPFSLTYGQWHSFRITYDGQTTNLYLDGHQQPDASVAQTYLRAPGKICIGNFSNPHTSTFYLDDLIISTSDAVQPARVYVQICSDTSTGGISVSSHYIAFPEADETYTSPAGQAAQVMAESYRTAHRDSLGNPVKFTWYMQCGSLYGYGATTGPLLPFELMQDNHGSEVVRWGDEMAFHYHTWIWNDPNGDGTFYWNQAPDFSYCAEDFDVTLAHLVLDRCFYPSSFRSGWHYMDNVFQCHLDDWIPYRFENDHPAIRTDTTEPIDNVYDWSRSPSDWVPYHPDPNDYQSPGTLRGWESRSRYLQLSKSLVEEVFLGALSGTPQVITLFSHLKEADFPAQVSNTHQMFAEIHDSLPAVDFEYLTGRECMLRWRNGTDSTPPTINYTCEDSGDVRTVTFATSEEIYQKQPFVAWRKGDSTYHRIDCTPLGANQWQVRYSLSDTLQIAVAVTDWFGNASVQFLPVPFRISRINTSAASTSAEIGWETNNPADTRLEYQLVSSGGTMSVYEGASVISHTVSLTGLLPGRVYRLRLSAEDAFGQYAESEDVYILTRTSDPAVVDNVDSGFSTTGTWTLANVASGRYGADYRYAMTSPTGTARASWTCQAQEPGVHTVSAWWSDGSNRSAAARYTVTYRGVEHTFTVDQQINGGQWNLLGTYDLTAGETISVNLCNTAPSGFVVIADAVMLEPAYMTLPGAGLARLLPDGNNIRISDMAVTAVLGSDYYAEELDRSSGMRVQGTGVLEGEVIEVCGELSTLDGERLILDPVVRKPGGTAHPRPLGIAGRSLCLDDSAHLTSAGLLVVVWGRVHAGGAGFFYLDDGSAVEDGSGSIGLRIDSTRLATPPADGEYAIVTGVVGASVVSGRAIPTIHPRRQSDIICY